MKSNSPAFDRLTARMKADPWHVKLRRWWWVKRRLLMLDLCGASLFIHFDAEGTEFAVARRPWLYKLLFRPHCPVVKIP